MNITTGFLIYCYQSFIQHRMVWSLFFVVIQVSVVIHLTPPFSFSLLSLFQLNSIL